MDLEGGDAVELRGVNDTDLSRERREGRGLTVVVGPSNPLPGDVVDDDLVLQNEVCEDRTGALLLSSSNFKKLGARGRASCWKKRS